MIHRTKILNVSEDIPNKGLKAAYAAMCTCGFIGAETPTRDAAARQADRHVFAQRPAADPAQLELKTK